MEKTKQRRESRPLMKKKVHTSERPEPPHNTTQYIIDANTSCAEELNLYLDHDRIGFNFQHHAMAGSMMGNTPYFRLY